MFRSVGLSYGARAIGVVLTGLLNDGAAGLADLKRCGGMTVVQNPSEASRPRYAAGGAAGERRRLPRAAGQLGPLLEQALRERRPLRLAPPPEDVRLEVEIALGRPMGTDEMTAIGDPGSLSCPACGGVLSQMRRSPPLRFRCQVGHGYTAETLASEQEGSVDEAMRVALRIVEERAVMTEKMAEEARRRRTALLGRLFRAEGKESREHVKTLREAIRRGRGAETPRPGPCAKRVTRRHGVQVGAGDASVRPAAGHGADGGALRGRAAGRAGQVAVRAEVGRVPLPRLQGGRARSSFAASPASRSAAFSRRFWPFSASLPFERFVVDGELVIEIEGRLSFDALQMRLHPAESRIRKLAAETPARLVLFDMLLSPDGADLTERAARRAAAGARGVRQEGRAGPARLLVTPVHARPRRGANDGSTA